MNQTTSGQERVSALDGLAADITALSLIVRVASRRPPLTYAVCWRSRNGFLDRDADGG
jgi:hypothetical protein